jgi:hypothetical protein
MISAMSLQYVPTSAVWRSAGFRDLLGHSPSVVLRVVVNLLVLLSGYCCSWLSAHPAFEMSSAMCCPMCSSV